MPPFKMYQLERRIPSKKFPKHCVTILSLNLFYLLLYLLAYKLSTLRLEDYGNAKWLLSL